MRIAVGADHLGRALKDQVKTHLLEQGHDVVDLGCGPDESVDYPDIAVLAASQIVDHSVARAVLVCGTGLGMAITANKVRGVRAATVSDPYSAERAARSNDAQVLCLGAQVVGPAVAPLLVDTWLAARFDEGRSGRKVRKIDAIEEAR